MPARSQAQRAYLNMKFGHAWVVKHGFDNTGPLPKHVKKRKRAYSYEALGANLRRNQ